MRGYGVDVSVGSQKNLAGGLPLQKNPELEDIRGSLSGDRKPFSISSGFEWRGNSEAAGTYFNWGGPDGGGARRRFG